MAPRSRRLIAVVATVVLVAGGCGDDANDDAGGVDVSDVWARSSPPGVTDGAAYMTIKSAADDVLVGVAAPTDVAAAVELHETVVDSGTGVADDHDMSATEGSAMTMRPVSVLELPAGEAVAFEPGGLHLMLTDLVEPLRSGSSFELTLTFAEAEPQVVTVEIRDEAP